MGTDSRTFTYKIAPGVVRGMMGAVSGRASRPGRFLPGPRLTPNESVMPCLLIDVDGSSREIVLPLALPNAPRWSTGCWGGPDLWAGTELPGSSARPMGRPRRWRQI
ncbi:hypothetical protein Hesp01_65070 [Herbidospora sp. NBRC 101105]|nr:hypothetical protein Hesp01_65070 [Herbidospora sp. NBRC 101105]